MGRAAGVEECRRESGCKSWTEKRLETESGVCVFVGCDAVSVSKWA